MRDEFHDAGSGLPLKTLMTAIRFFLLMCTVQFSIHASWGCMAGPTREREQFSVAWSNPSSGTVASNQRFEVRFNRQVRADSVTSCSLILIREQFAGEAAELFSKGPSEGANAEKAECAGADFEMNGDTISFSPAGRLEPGRNYYLAAAPTIRDTKGYKLGGGDGVPFVAPESFHVSLEGFNPAGELVVTEVMANPAGDEAGAEFVEVFNPGLDAVDLHFWKLGCGAGCEQMISDCGRTAVIGSGAYGLVGGASFSMGGLGENIPVACVKGRLAMKGLLNSAGQQLTLSSPDGRVVSSYGGWLSSSEEGRSIERKDAGLPDEKGSWVLSSVTGGTPGAPVESGGDLVPARLVRFDPSGSNVGTTAVFSLLFDRPVGCNKEDGCVRICPDEPCCETGKGAVEGKTVQGALEELAEFTPAAALKPLTGYLLGVSDFRDSGSNAVVRSYCLPFTTGLAPDTTPPKARLSYPSDGAREIPANLSMVTVQFPEPVRFNDAGAIAIVTNGRSLTLSCRSGGTGTGWACDLPESPDCGAASEVVMAGAVTDMAGNLARQGNIGRFWTCCEEDLSAPLLELSVISRAPLGFAAMWKASEPCMFSWRLVRSAGGDAIDEGITALAAAEGVTVHEAPVAEGDYLLTGECLDPAGNKSGTVSTIIRQDQLPPSVVVNEIMVNPAGSDTDAEFVELFNYGGEAIDLSGWKISRCEEPAKGLVLSPHGGFAISPGQFVLVVSKKDDGEGYPWDARLLKLEGGPIPGGLSNSHSEEICLFDSEGNQSASFRGWLVPGEGLSAERVSGFRPDCRDNWAISTVKGGTPGAANSVSE